MSTKRTDRAVVLLIAFVMALTLLPTAVLASPGDVTINATNFPDEIFRTYVSENYDTSKDNTLSTEEIAKVTSIDVSGKNITSLKGVEHFTALTELNCGENMLTSIDVSKNTNMTDLYCYDNHLTSIDVSNNTKLTLLTCHENQLASIDVSKNTELTELAVSDNQLSAVDVSNNKMLEVLYAERNHLTSLDVSNNTGLTILYCHGNQLTSLDVSKNTALEMLMCFENQLAALDLSKNTALTELDCSKNSCPITSSENHTFDLSTLPGFDVTKAKNFSGSSVSGNILTVKAEEISYDYDCGNGKTERFTLTASIASHTHTPTTEWTTDETHHWHICSVCSEILDKAPHTFGEWETVKDSTATEEGLKMRSCSVCGYEESLVIPLLGHEHSYSDTWKSNSVNHWHECNCGDKADEAVHTFGKWITVKEATATTEGSVKRICTICRYEEYDTVAVNGQATNSFPWWSIVVAVVAIAGVAAVIVIVKKKK